MSGSGKSIDVQHFCLLVNRVFQDEAAKLSGLQVKKAESLLSKSSVPGLDEALQQIPARQYTLEQANPGDELMECFFSPDFLPDAAAKETKEDILWKLRLANSGNALPVCVMKLAQELPSIGYESLTRRVFNLQPVMVAVITLHLDKLDLRRVEIIPNQVNVLKTVTGVNSELEVKTVEDFEPGQNVVKRLILGFTDNKAMDMKRGNEFFTRENVLDISGMQYGLRGPNKELVSALEDIVQYIPRLSLTGKIKRISKMPEKLSKAEQEHVIEEVTRSNPLVARTVSRVLEILISGQQWCHYCGVIMRLPKKCGACKRVFYCGQNCQKLHWRGHKEACASSSQGVTFVRP